ncbi:hypothetical protein B0H10DRAFT_1943422 [Mycena sp. CBHHK59/15]|nr:hypothetical protein B0H10DRAFT_1943422 [Mycena sp. CBHHK59/15]
MDSTADSPLDIQEVVDHCIDFLHDSVPDLRACALVHRSWVDAAQFHLFRHISFSNVVENQNVRCSRFLDIFGASPRNARIRGFVSRFEVRLRQLTHNNFVAISPLFPRLRHIHISGTSKPHVPPLDVSALRQLLSLPTVERVEIYYWSFANASEFLQIWEGCSRSIRHLSLGRIGISSDANHWITQQHSATHSTRRIKLESLDIWEAQPISSWLADGDCQFDFSHLKTLRPPNPHGNT